MALYRNTSATRIHVTAKRAVDPTGTMLVGEPTDVIELSDAEVALPGVKGLLDEKVLVPATGSHGKEVKRAEDLKVEAPKAEAPKVEAPKVEEPKVEAPKADTHKADHKGDHKGDSHGHDKHKK